MLGQFARLRRWEQTDDILQAALLKLHTSLATVNPPTVREFYALAAVQIRRVLLDLARHYFGPEGPALWHQSPPAGALSSGWLTEHAGPASREPLTLADWTDFHTHVAALPDDLRETFELLFFHGLTQNQAAALLGVSEKTVHRRWYKARVSLADAVRSGQ
jgi:RNA polymerase sigma-70 factor (ECF subfamily)